MAGFPLLRRVLHNRFALFFRSVGTQYSSFSGGISEKGSETNKRSSPVPFLMLPPSMDESGKMVYKFHSVSNKEDMNYSSLRRRESVELARSSHGWIIFYNKMNHDVFLWNPMSSRHMKLPSLSTLDDPEIIFGGGISIWRVGISDGCHVMMIVGEERRLAFCVAGSSTKWLYPIGDEEKKRQYGDVVYSKRHKLFFCMTRFSTELELEGWSVSPTIDLIWRVQLQHSSESDADEFDSRSRIHWLPQASSADAFKLYCWHLRYLVFAEQSEELFLVVRHVNPRMRPNGSTSKCVFLSKYRGLDRSYPYKTTGFDVYKIDIDIVGEVMKLRRMESSLEGLAMFVGINESYAVPASDDQKLKGNCIYFADENRHARPIGSLFADSQYRGNDNGIFNYETKAFSSCCTHSLCPLNPSTTALNPNPPPLWLMPWPLK